MLELRALALERDRVAPRRRELGLRAGRVELVDLAQVEAPLQQANVLLAQPYGVAEKPELGVRLAQCEVGLGDVGLQRKLDRIERRL